LTRGGADQLPLGSCAAKGCHGCRSHSFRRAGSPNCDALLLSAMSASRRLQQAGMRK
jgi:hypothetical protein